MNANRTLGLLAAILVTAVQATVLAVDTRSVPESEATPVHYGASINAPSGSEARVAYSPARALTGG
jgi:hypothetical protein